MSRRLAKPSSTPNAVVLGHKAFAAISAVEGLKLNAAGRQRIARLTGSDLSPAQRRAVVLKAYLGPDAAK